MGIDISRLARCAVTGSAAIFLPTATHADPLSYSNDSGGAVTFYGQLSPTYLGFDDGEETYSNLADNAHSNSRVGFDIDQDFANGTKLRFKFETALGAPQSSDFSQDAEPIWTWEKTDLRKIEFIFSGEFGTVSLGQGSMVTDGVAKQDLSLTDMASTVTTNDTAGSYYFRNANGSLSDVALSDVFDTFDGSRKGRIRYDTPHWNGLSVGLSYGTDILSNYGDTFYYDLGAYYAAELGDVQYAAGLGYGWKRPSDSDETAEEWSGSLSVLHKPSGINGTVATGAEIDGGRYLYGKIGWIADFWAGGATALSADYYGGRDFLTDGSDSTQWGLQAVQYVDEWNLQAYLGYAEYAFKDDIVADYLDASSLLAGVRWNF